MSACAPARTPPSPRPSEPLGRVWAGLPLLVPSGPRSTVHSSMVPKGSNIFRTSSSVCCFPSIPTKSFRSSGRQGTGGGPWSGPAACFRALSQPGAGRNPVPHLPLSPGAPGRPHALGINGSRVRKGGCLGVGGYSSLECSQFRHLCDGLEHVDWDWERFGIVTSFLEKGWPSALLSPEPAGVGEGLSPKAQNLPPRLSLSAGLTWIGLFIYRREEKATAGGFP